MQTPFKRAGISDDNSLGRKIVLKLHSCPRSFAFGKLFIFRTMFQPRALSYDIPAAGRGLLTATKISDINYTGIFSSQFTGQWNPYFKPYVEKTPVANRSYCWQTQLRQSDCILFT